MRLKLALGEMVDAGKERYGLNWPGKAESSKSVQRPSLGTLRPCNEESINFDTTGNLIIEGDNLEAMKLLQKSYLGKIKMIYIDPPYNTGNDFIYPDNYTETLQTYLEYTGQADAQGKRFGTNSDTDGRFHSAWLTMMYPRLLVARDLLQSDGIICISIDDSELENLKRICNEIFGEENFVGVIVVQANKRGQTYKEIAKSHEYVLVYSKEPDLELNELAKADEALPYKDSKGPFDLWELRNRNPKFGRFNRPNLFFPIYVAPTLTDENGYSKISLKRDRQFSIEALPLNSESKESCWRWGTEKVLASDLSSSTPVVVARKTRDGKWNIYERSRKSTTKAKSIWVDTDVISEQGTIQLGELGLADCFEHPKPLGLLMRCLRIGTSPDSIVLDFFAGSGTTAHAVLQLNNEDGGTRKFILIQLPERLDPENRQQKAAAELCDSIGKPRNLAEITKERVRRVLKKLNEDGAGKLGLADKEKEDLGFRAFRLAESNFKTWNADSSRNAAGLVHQLDMHVDHIRDGRTAGDLLYEILLKSGFQLPTPVTQLKLAGKLAFSVANGGLLVCLERALTLDLIRAIANEKPARVVCLDAGFAGNDQLKANAVQIFKTKGITSFKTV